MQLLIFKITGDDDYGALSFKNSGRNIEDIHDEMLEKEIDSVEHSTDESHWIVSLEHTLDVKSEDEVERIIQLLNDITDDDWCGDYDSRKNTDWDCLLIEDEE